jgi:hypothetical protein
MPLKTVRLRGGLRKGFGWLGELRSEAAIRGAELGDAGWPGRMGFGGGVAGVGQRGVGDGADSQGPLDRER